MNLYLRLFWVWLTSLFRPKLSGTAASVLYLPVLPNDLDVYFHLNNGRYLTLMDLGRIDWIFRSGVWAVSCRRKWNPLVAGISIRYRRPIYAFQVFRLTTRVVSWDEKWFFIEQVFERKGEVLATAHVRGLFRGPEGNVSTSRVFAEIGVNLPAPPLPAWAAEN